ncbi:DNA primase [Saccharicrinis fermentans DSM 9555 = JCM 21142]|uniref:DNA primase n=1 Tax=Saccharicrinis fermentans DSM 9555 = JCM 21142 TaxID=869213 RepID=W7Y1M8_9BACT|nr:tyrosine-type recombinase/integrase [Saccharicrinis fermentans]GAF04800.1 DNA primase [Saccharicrinis fermentans DSM 9555 = JCM 21142]
MQHYNLKPDRNNQIKCPFHEDDKPSCRIYADTNTFHCFGCNATGDQIEFIEKYKKCSKHEAILKAKQLCGIPEPIKAEKPKAKPTPINGAEILTKSFTHFARSLNAKPKKAIEYLESRKLNYKALSIGYDAGTLHKAKDITNQQKQEYLQTGLLKPDKFGRENSYYTRFNNCIVFPLLDKSGNIKSLYGRHVEKGHHYLEGEHKGLYPKYPSEDTTKLILTEAIIDAATLLQVPEIIKDFSILALYGTNGFTEEHGQTIAELIELKEVILFFDGDEAGTEAIKEIAAELKQIKEKLQISVVETPEGEDLNSLSIGHEPEIFTHLIENRKPFSFSIESSGSTPNNSSSEKEKPFIQPITSGLKVASDYMQYETDQLTITLWGGIEMHTVNRLRATLHIKLKGNDYQSFRDTADLYSHNQTDRLIKQASEKLEISTSITNEAITGLTKELESYRQQKREEKRQSEESKEQQGIDRFSREQMQEANEFIRYNELTQLTYSLFNKLGMIGQQDNATLLFFIFLTRFFKNPLHAIVMGSSGSGKTHLLQGVAKAVPKQHINVTTSLSENALYYTPKDFLKNKILMQEDLDGAYNALLPLRELMSNQSISRFSTKTNSRTGDSKQVYLHVKGPVCVAGATTKDKVYEDNANRSFLIQIEESPKHEAQVMEHQGKVAAGLIDFKKYEQNVNLLKASQLLIEPMEVLIAFAPKLELPPHVFKKMRTKNHYLTLIKSITLWNQKQRKITTDKEGNKYLISTLEDVQWANFLCKDTLLRKSDELGGKTRNFFESLKELVMQWEVKTFYAKDVRKYLRMHPMTLQRHFIELEKRGMLRCVSRSNKPGNEYEISVWDDFEELKSGIEMMDTILEKLKKSEPSQPSQRGQAAHIFIFQLNSTEMIPTEIISPQFKQLETSFANWLQTLNYSTETIKTRKRNIKEFLLYLERCNINTIEILTNEKTKRFKRYLKRRENKLYGSGLMNASINVGISSVNKFFEYLQQTGNPTPDNLEYVEEIYKQRNIISLNEINELYKTSYQKHHFTNIETKAKQEAVSQRDRAMLSIYYGCGLRKSEGTNLVAHDILTERKLIHVRKGKGSKERYVPVTGNNLNHITEYLQNGRNFLLNQNETDSFFINQYGTACSDQALTARLKRSQKTQAMQSCKERNQVYTVYATQ